MPSNTLSYVLISPARNEEVMLPGAIRSMAAQTVLPLRWVIVSDGSTDGTDDVVRAACEVHGWIRHVRLPQHRERDFAAKVQAFNAGLESLRGLEYDVLGNLDADITFGEGYFQFLLERFQEDQSLGVTGTPFVENGSQYNYRFTSAEHVSGACQLFRRECFEDIGGYVPIKGGGIDWTAVTTARMKGWRTRTFTEQVCHHHRKLGTGSANPLGAWFRHGRKDYFLGGHPIWQLFRAMYQMRRRPVIIGGLLLLAGYAWAGVTRTARVVSPELMEFHRKEQLKRLTGLLARFRRWVPGARRGD